MNDAKADRNGILWAGSLNPLDETQPDGSLFRIDLRTQSLEMVDTGYCVANGPAIHPDGCLLLHTDSVRRVIYAFDLDPATSQITNKRVWKTLTAQEGHPDGMTFDAEGCLWLAHWGTGWVSRYSPAGELMRRVQLPASHVTNVCFGGPGLDRMFVTSARAGLSPQQLEAEPLAGALFELDALGVTGLPARTARS